MKTRRPVWKILAAVAAVLLLGIGLFFGWVQAVANRRWSALEQRVPELIAEARARDPRRPVLRGEAVPGNAWDDYEQALAAIKGMQEAYLNDYVYRTAKADRAKVEAALAAAGGALDFLSAGASKAEAAYPYRFEQGWAADLPGLLTGQKLVYLAVCRARFLLEAGRSREALDLLLDGLQFSADFGRNGTVLTEMGSVSMLSTMIDEFIAQTRAAAWKGADREELIRALARLDGAFPDYGESVLNEALLSTVDVVQPERQPAAVFGQIPGALSAWRYGFSTRIMMADALDTYLAVMKRTAAASRVSWAEVQKTAAEVEGELKEENNPVVKSILPHAEGALRVVLESRAKLRLLRMLLGASDLDDPFGGKLRSDGSKVWSVGPDGVDDGGVGAWKPAKTGDIVLELKGK